MIWIDYVFIFILVLNLYNGYKEGLIRQIVALAGFFIAFYCALTWSGDLSSRLQEFLRLDRVLEVLWKDGAANLWLAEVICNIVVYIIIFIVISLLIKIISRKLTIINDIPIIGSLNATLGTVFGLAKGLLIIFLIVALLSLIKVPFFSDLMEVSVFAALSQQYLALLFNLINTNIVNNLGQLL